MKYNIVKLFCALGLIYGFASCTDYLDKTPDSNVSSDQAFKNFTNFKGYVEQMYNCIPSKESNMYCTSFNWGEDEIIDETQCAKKFYYIIFHFIYACLKIKLDTEVDTLHRRICTNGTTIT